MTRLSVVTTLYKSSAFIAAFYERATVAARAYAGDDYEMIFVNDGSPDDSLDKVIELTRRDPHVVIVDLSRNFGHHKAMMTGLVQSCGQDVFLIDVDLEEEPEWLQKFAEMKKAQAVDVVYGRQEARKGKWFERCTGGWFYKLFRFLTGLDLPDNVATARLMSRRYVDALIRHGEREVFMAGLWLITGFSQLACTVRKHSREGSTYTLARKVSLLVNAVTSFSNAPLVAIFYVGLAILFVAGLYALNLVALWIFWAKPPAGWTSVMASIWLLGGLMISFIGLIGIYLSKVFSETKQRPYTIIRQVYGRDNKNN